MTDMALRRAVEEVKERTSIVEVAAKYIHLRKAGQAWVGLCPFHNDKKPSLHVHDAKGFYHCFSCGAGGDVIRFLMEMEQLTFIEAVRELAERIGMQLPDSPRGRSGGDDGAEARQRLLACNREAALLYHRLLLRDPEAAAARAYLASRDVTDKDTTRFGLGYAPSSWTQICDHLRARGFSDREIEQSGLSIPGQHGPYDRFRDRLMFPILMREGSVLGFSGRIMSKDTDTAKYLNTPETPLYQKSKVLFGYHLAKDGIRAAGRVLLVEGNFDVLRMHQHGFANTVAPCGTALGEDQLRIIRRSGCSLTLLFDGDEAGVKAAWRATPAVMAQGIEAKVAFLPEGQDPDDFLRHSGAEAMQTLLDGAEDLFPAWVKRLRHSAGNSPESISDAARQTAEVLAGIDDETARGLYQSRSAYLLGVPEGNMARLVLQAQRRIRQRGGDSAPEYVGPAGAAKAQTETRTQPVAIPPTEAEVLGLLLVYPHLLDQETLRERLVNAPVTPETRNVIRRVLDEGDDLTTVLAGEPMELAGAVRATAMNASVEDAESTMLFFLNAIELDFCTKQEDDVALLLRKAEAEHDEEGKEALMRRRGELARRRDWLKRTQFKE